MRSDELYQVKGGNILVKDTRSLPSVVVQKDESSSRLTLSVVVRLTSPLGRTARFDIGF